MVIQLVVCLGLGKKLLAVVFYVFHTYGQRIYCLISYQNNSENNRKTSQPFSDKSTQSLNRTQANGGGGGGGGVIISAGRDASVTTALQGSNYLTEQTRYLTCEVPQRFGNYAFGSIFTLKTLPKSLMS